MFFKQNRSPCPLGKNIAAISHFHLLPKRFALLTNSALINRKLTAPSHRLQWQLPGNWTLHFLMWSSSFCMDWNCFKYIIRSSALSAPMVSLITSCRGQNSPVPWDLWFLIPSFSLTQIVLLMQNSRFPNSFYPFFESASCTEPVMNYIVALSRPTQTAMYETNQTDWSSGCFLRLAMSFTPQELVLGRLK